MGGTGVEKGREVGDIGTNEKTTPLQPRPELLETHGPYNQKIVIIKCPRLAQMLAQAEIFILDYICFLIMTGHAVKGLSREASDVRNTRGPFYHFSYGNSHCEAAGGIFCAQHTQH